MNGADRIEQLWQDPQSVDLIWIQTGFIGDIVLTTAAIEAAAKCLPGVKQFVVTTPIGGEVLKNHPSVTGTIVFEKRKSSTIEAFTAVSRALALARARGGRTVSPRAIILQPHMSYRSSLLAMFLGFPRVVFKEAALTIGAFAKVDRIAVFHETARVGMLLTAIGVARENFMLRRPRLAEKDEPELGVWGQWLKVVENRKIVGIAPGSVWGTKRWPREGFVKVITWLLRERHAVVLLGSSSEKGLCTSVASLVRKEVGNEFPERDRYLLDLSGATSIDDLKFIYRRFAALVSNDSSPIHFASSYNVPTVAIFGATVPAMGFGPLADGSVTVGIEINCRPCSDHGPQICPLGHFDCMRKLGPDKVIQPLKRILGG